jgi:hypothetical protein
MADMAELNEIYPEGQKHRFAQEIQVFLLGKAGAARQD